MHIFPVVGFHARGVLKDDEDLGLWVQSLDSGDQEREDVIVVGGLASKSEDTAMRTRASEVSAGGSTDNEVLVLGFFSVAQCLLEGKCGNTFFRGEEVPHVGEVQGWNILLV